MFKATDYAKVWERVNWIYKNRTEESKPADLLKEVRGEFGDPLVVETFAAVAQLKHYDGRIYGMNRKWTDSIEVNPDAIKWDYDNPLIRAGVDDIHTANVNLLITELRKELT